VFFHTICVKIVFYSKHFFQDDNHLRIIFSLLTGKQINAACQVAQSNGDSRLSLLLAQSSGNMIVRQWLLKQLDDWLEHKVNIFILS
jgi:nuclear pore complex protein Nup98-Nup96